MGWSLAMGTLWTLTGQWVSIYYCAWLSVPAGKWDGDHQCEMRSIQNVAMLFIHSMLLHQQHTIADLGVVEQGYTAHD